MSIIQLGKIINNRPGQGVKRLFYFTKMSW
nr:MAG TPA: hypothetical protein [Caudoviricetes sp.]